MEALGIDLNTWPQTTQSTSAVDSNGNNNCLVQSKNWKDKSEERNKQ